MRDSNILSASYRYFLAVAEAGSIRGAAKALNIVPSAVNRQVLLLESQIGIDLFERVGRGLRLSEPGQVLAKQIRDILSAYDETAAELDAFRGLKRGRVRIATVESVSVNLLPDLLAGFWAAFPGIEIVTRVTGSDAVTRLVEEGEVDIGFSFNPETTGAVTVLHEEPFRIGALLPPDHPLASRGRVTLGELVAQPFALPARGLSLRAALEPALVRLGRIARPRLESDSLRHMASLAVRGQVIAFQTAVGIERELAERSVVLVPLSDPDVDSDRLTVLIGTGRTPSLAIAVFIEHLRVAVGTWNRLRDD